MYQRALTKNTLFYGDNLDILRQYVAAESIDLIYLDPPFNSNRNYNVLYKEENSNRQDACSTLKAFEDIWHWNHDTEEQYRALVARRAKLGTLLEALVSVNGRNQMTAYLIMMAIRLVELHRVLKPTGSLYLHCDPTASHYLKLLLDCIFGADNFRNEIVWERTRSIKSSQFKDKKLSVNSDSILFYTKSGSYVFNSDAIKARFTEEEIAKRYPFADEKGRFTKSPIFRSMSMGERPNLCYEYKGVRNPNQAGWKVSLPKLIEIEKQGDLGWSKTGIPFRKYRPEQTKGFKLTNIWTDIEMTSGAERLGYPTQKPVALLERILQASSNPGDVVLDPFCGCGTAVHAAQKLDRIWVGIEKLPLAIELIRKRLSATFKLEAKEDYALLEAFATSST